MSTNLVDLGPSSLYPRNIVQHRTVLPERACLDAVDESYCGKVEILCRKLTHSILINYNLWSRCTSSRALVRDWVPWPQWRCQLSGTKDIRDKGMVVEAPYSMRTSWFQRVSLDQIANKLEIAVPRQSMRDQPEGSRLTVQSHPPRCRAPPRPTRSEQTH